MQPVWGFVTDFGDSAVTAPLALLTAVVLFAAGHRRLALGWALAIGGCAIAIGGLKLIFGACGASLTIARIVSPSGHTAMSTAVYGSLALLVGARLSPPWRVLLFAAAAMAITTIALSRLTLGNHSPAEIALGLVVGLAAVAVFRSALRRAAPPKLPLGWLLLGGGVLVVVMHGARWMIEPTVHRLAWDLRFALPWCR